MHITPLNKRVNLSIIIPVFNEDEVIDLFIDSVDAALSQNTLVSIEFIFVNDGSTDSTLEKLLLRQNSDNRIKIIDLSRNFGKESALTAGLHLASGDIIVPIDVDLQDPPLVINQMITKWGEGFEVILGRRINRNTDSWIKRISAYYFYRLHNKIAAPKVPCDVGDFRLMDKKVVKALNEMGESRRFMKGLFAWVGFRTTYVDYVREARAAGNTKFNGWKLWNFALEGITSFSTVPLTIWIYLGLLTSLISLAFGLYIVIRTITLGIEVPGYASLIVGITFLGGLQLIGIGVIGEYLGRSYIESKRRPIYIARHIYMKENDGS